MSGRHGLAARRTTIPSILRHSLLLALSFLTVTVLSAVGGERARSVILPFFNLVVLLGAGVFGWPGAVLTALASGAVTVTLLGASGLGFAATFVAVGLGAGVLVALRTRALSVKVHEYEALAAEHVAAFENFERYKEKKDALDRRLVELTALQGATSALAAASSLSAIYTTVLDTASKLCACDSTVLCLLDEECDALVIRESRGSFGAWKAGERFSLEQGLLGFVARHGQPELVHDVNRDPRFVATAEEGWFKSFLAVPLFVEARIVGVLGVARVDEPDFTRDDMFTLSSLASQTAVNLHRAFLHQELERLAITDGLTGLFNRRYFEESLRKEVARAERYQGRFSIILCDVDHFKNYNDKNGHPAGDRLLREVSQIVQRSIRGIDVAARYGGEEFVVVLPETDADAALKVAERIRVAVRSLDGEGASRQPLGHLSLSLGVATFPLHAHTGEGVVKAADAALYTAKQEGRDRAIVATV